jgi:hypothetical protein
MCNRMLQYKLTKSKYFFVTLNGKGLFSPASRKLSCHPHELTALFEVLGIDNQYQYVRTTRGGGLIDFRKRK